MLVKQISYLVKVVKPIYWSVTKVTKWMQIVIKPDLIWDLLDYFSFHLVT